MDIILVHGAYHQSTCWNKVAPILHDFGLRTHCVSLPGHSNNNRNNITITMHSYVKEVLKTAKNIGRPCTLIGHSMAGLIITAAAEKKPEYFNNLIYLSAIVPEEKGTSLLQFNRQFPNKPLNKLIKTQLTACNSLINDEAAVELFYNHCDEQTKDIAYKELCPQPIRPIFKKVKGADNFGKVRKSYIECSEDQIIPIKVQHELQTRCYFNKTATLNSDHSPFYSMPLALAKAIILVSK